MDGIEEENDLGVLFNSSLKFGNHINKIVHKANRLLGLIKRTFSYLEPQILSLLHTTLIRPHLDYACLCGLDSAWNPYQSGDIRALEQVQRRVTRACPTLFHRSYYDQQLVTLNLPSLQYRRRRMDMIMMYKILNGLDGLPFDLIICSVFITLLQDLMGINFISTSAT